MDDNNDDREVNVAIAALVISVLALLGVVLQYVQAIIGRTNGLWIRDEAVMGKWAAHAQLKWSWFLGEVQYEAPIIFLAPTNNKRGPVAGEIWYVDGSQESCEKTRVEQPRGLDASKGLEVRERVHTVQKELATWIVAIGAAQKMERDSKEWEGRKWRNLGEQPPSLPETVSLAVAIQPMTRSFDKHPAVNRPYASTTICHIIELCAVLGIYWKEFDRGNDKYRAEGNGYSLLGMRVADFGLVFTFEKPGWPRFEKNRVIPTSEVKELSFGNVPTLYRPKEEDRHWGEPINEQTDGLKTLQLGSRTEIAETLNLIRCNEYTTQCYSDSTKKHVHLFPVVFEVLGMLARPFHIKNRPFTYLPNPAAFALNKQAFSPRRLLHEFQVRLHEEMSSSSHEQRSKEDALYRVDSWATRLNSGLPKQVDGDYSPKLLNQLHEAIDVVDKFLLEDNTKDVVLDVLRRHVQEVLLAINTSAKDVEFDGGNNSPTTVASSHHPASAPPTATHAPNLSTLRTAVDAVTQQHENVSFDYLLKVPHEKREWALMETYFGEIRFRAVSLSTSQEYHDPQAAEASRDIHRDALGLALQPIPTNEAPAPAAAAAAGAPTQTQHSTPQIGTTSNTMSRQTTFSAAQERFRRGVDTWGTLGAGSVYGVGFNRLNHPNEIRRDTIWCALVFRMICWLLLHDFDKKDVQIPKSELMGSRLPVFIV